MIGILQMPYDWFRFTLSFTKNSSELPRGHWKEVHSDSYAAVYGCRLCLVHGLVCDFIITPGLYILQHWFKCLILDSVS